MVVLQQHDHPLTLIDLNTKYPHDEPVYDDEIDLITKQAFQCTCGRCDKKITYFHRYYYKCDICDYSLHKLCLELPKTLEHTSHLEHTLVLFQNESRLECYACKCSLLEKQLCYHCSRCKLNICLDCDTNKVHHQTIYHPSHQHPLIPTSRKISTICDACGKKHKGVFYHCITCFRSFIHEVCVFRLKRLLIQDGTRDKFFHSHPLTLTYTFDKADQQAKFYPRCKVCNNTFKGHENFWTYRCEKCRYYAHLDCAYFKEREPSGVRGFQKPEILYKDDADVLRLPLSDQAYNNILKSFVFKETNEKSLSHNSHEHPLILVDTHECNDIIKTMNKNDALCNACLTPIRENMMFYKCTFKDHGCNFVIHEWCTRLPIKLKGHKHHPEHTLILLPKAGNEFYGFTCYVCGRICNGFAYSCDECNCYINVFCAFVPTKFTHKSHPYHLLSRVKYRYSRDDYCRLCLRGFMYDGETSLSCRSCRFDLHLGCALSLPETIKHRYDKHPMTLTYNPLENHEGDYFCEVCEEELNPNACFYHCHDCVQSTHTTCAPLIPQSKLSSLSGALIVHHQDIKFGSVHKTKYHPHPLSFLMGTESDYFCVECGHILNGSWILKCLECLEYKFAIHEECKTTCSNWSNWEKL